MHYRIILSCTNPKDEDKYGRDLHMNNFEAAQATMKNLLTGAFDNIIDGYIIEWWSNNELYYKVEKR